MDALPSAWRLGFLAKILDNLEFLAKIWDFFYFFILCQDLARVDLLTIFSDDHRNSRLASAMQIDFSERFRTDN